MSGTRQKVLRGARYGNWGLVLAAVLGAGISIYAVADPEMRSSSLTTADSVKPAAVCAENLDQAMVEVGAFDPFLAEEPSPALQDVASPSDIEMDEALAAANPPDPTLLSEQIGLEEPSKVAAPRQTSSQLAANAQRTPPGRPKRPARNPNRSHKPNPWGKGGQYSWVLPTAIIAGGATGITLGTIAIVRNNQGSSKKNPPLTQ